MAMMAITTSNSISVNALLGGVVFVGHRPVFIDLF